MVPKPPGSITSAWEYLTKSTFRRKKKTQKFIPITRIKSEKIIIG